MAWVEDRKPHVVCDIVCVSTLWSDEYQPADCFENSTFTASGCESCCLIRSFPVLVEKITCGKGWFVDEGLVYRLSFILPVCSWRVVNLQVHVVCYLMVVCMWCMSMMIFIGDKILGTSIFANCLFCS